MGDFDNSVSASQLSTETTQGERDDDSWHSVFLLACCMVAIGVLLSLLFVTLLVFLGDQGDSDMGGDTKATYDKVPSSGNSSGGGEVISTLQQPAPTPVTSAEVQHPVTREQEIIPTPYKGVPSELPTTLKITPAPPTPAPPTTLAPLVDKPPQRNAYICTVASDGEMETPRDGLCDFTFYESLGKPFERPGEASKGKFATFKSMAAKGQKTQFGISIFALDIGAFLIHLSKQSAKAWAQENLWNHNIHHWGVLNIYETIFNQPGYLRNATLSLKRALEISDPSPTKRVVSYTFLGYYAKQPAGCDEAAEIMKIPESIRYRLKYGHTLRMHVEVSLCLSP
ncbi:uncharacterized protein [Dermacentor albipictus]|uniref:uncharacterized protein isoform X13 n=1 Tax=Dermacentor albipictus TaxID=60249 RepID=UPI0038FCDEE9